MRSRVTRSRMGVPEALLLMMLLSACVSTPLLRYAELPPSARPLLSVEYYPYGAAVTGALAAPHPRVLAWTDTRMQRDLARIADAGFQLLWVDVSAELVQQPAKLERLAAFVGYADALDRLPVAFRVRAEGLDRAAFAEFLDYCLGLNLQRRQRYYRVAGQPVIELVAADALRGIDHPGIELVHRSWRQTGAGLPESLDYAQLDASSTVLALPVAVVAGEGAREWRWRRRRDDVDLRLGLALALRPAELRIRSWNDYATGAFIEPNSMDGSALLEAITDWACSRPGETDR